VPHITLYGRLASTPVCDPDCTGGPFNLRRPSEFDGRDQFLEEQNDTAVGTQTLVLILHSAGSSEVLRASKAVAKMWALACQRARLAEELSGGVAGSLSLEHACSGDCARLHQVGSRSRLHGGSSVATKEIPQWHNATTLSTPQS
jgi:hypothetical protein